jgi:hypothetical protein
MRIRLSVGLLLALMIVATDAGAQAYRWVDESGHVNYAGTRDQVPERYRSQLPPVVEPESPVTPTSGPTPDFPPGTQRPAPGKCLLIIQGTPLQPGGSRSYANCADCSKAIDAMPADEAARAACVRGGS